ncbi:MAG: hypothetical protein R2932_01745 [Caldilineaceae bacterium]
MALAFTVSNADSIHRSDCQLTLPIRTPSRDDETLAPFAPAEGAAPLPVQVLRTPSQRKGHHYDSVQHHLQHFDEVTGRRHRCWATALVRTTTRNYFDLSEADPCSAQVRCEHTISLKRDDGPPRV